MATLGACGGDGDEPPMPDDGGTVVPMDGTVAPPGDIGPEGGTVTSDDGRLTLTIPAGALTEPTPIRIVTRTGMNLASLSVLTYSHAYSLSPDGLEFDAPVLATLRADAEDVPPDNVTLYTNVYGLISQSEEHGFEVVGVGIDRELDDGSIEFAGVITHFSNLALGRVLQSRFDLDCGSECVPLQTYEGRYRILSRFEWEPTPNGLVSPGGIGPRAGSRGITGSGPLMVESNPITTGVSPQAIGSELVWTFDYRCTGGGEGILDGHFHGYAAPEVHPNIPVIINESRVGSWAQASVTCEEPPVEPTFEVFSVSPVAGCPNSQTTVTARGFESHEAVRASSIVFISPDGSQTVPAVIETSTPSGTAPLVEGVFEVRVPRGVERGTMHDWAVAVELADSGGRSATRLFRGQVADCPMADTSFVGNHRTITDLVADDADCTGVNNASAWRFWPDGSWTPTAPRISDVVNGESVRRMGGTWTGAWDGNAYEFTATQCPSPSGRTLTVVGRWYPETGVMEARGEGVNRNGIPYVAQECSLGSTVLISGCHAGMCQPDVEPHAAEATCFHTMAGDCYPDVNLTCYDNNGLRRR